MKALSVIALAVTLAGCTCPVRSVPTAAQTVARPVALKVDAQNGRSTIAANKQSPQAAEADPVTEKAKAAIAALMENPATAQFSKMSRAFRNLSSESLDTICGYVKGKDASGRDTGDMPFLYIIDNGEPFLVDGSSSVIETVYRSLCD